MTFVPMTAEALEDGARLMQELACVMWLSGLRLRPPTFDEATEGRQTYQHEDHEHIVSIGWRAEQERVEEDARRDAEMAACPYVACTCGHHEE